MVWKSNKLETFSVRVTSRQAKDLRQAHINATIVGKLKREEPMIYLRFLRELDYEENDD